MEVHQKKIKLMGNRFEISIVSDDKNWAFEIIEEAVKEIQRIETLLTTFDENSQTNQINKFAGIKPVKIDKEVFELIERCNRISQLTQGAFDITYGSINKKLWNFDTSMTALPSQAVAKKMVQLINYKNIELNKTETSVFLKEKGMRIGFGGIGKGYGAEKAKKIMQNNGVQSGIVNASGDLTVWGKQPNGKPWTIGIADPNNAKYHFSSLELTNTSIATSGNYEKFILIDGKKYSHTINPKTGLPIEGIKSVTLITPNAEFADAMATPISVMGIKVGLNLINQINNLEGIIIDDSDNIFTSKNIKLN
ncbi:MAG: FAD:protein FMN transferase [Bacteroidetes bacterium]|nr:FAD:protein FMN transferase [Bacteroidota bacterium]MBP7256816.1 FAD:protein FMN transferase [Chitinophagales bacterium]MBK7638602.1 FAD:protein FMN transferase [Bacteroidota bacterium]MBK8672132.1 FAD:protein FMN transferase [Bacteroidota bacterium]MBK9354697.1 FAD:protein FMN transferase [Bacteroidota bacterium]